jgi:hypothetical protein
MSNMLQDYWTNWYKSNPTYLDKTMTVIFKSPLNTPEPPIPTFFNKEEHLSMLLKELETSPKQTDGRGYFVQYYTTSTKKPYVWERYDAFSAVKSDEYANYFNHAKSELQQRKDQHDWQGIKLVAFSFDSLNPMYGVNILKEYCFEIVNPKKKNYINGKNASQEFLAKKGKIYTNEKTV